MLAVPLPTRTMRMLLISNRFFHFSGLKITLGRRRVSHRYRADEMFVFLGPALVKRIVARRYCHSLDIGDCDDKRDLYDTNFAGQSLHAVLYVFCP